MKCAIHSTIDTETTCLQCGTALCEQCNVGDEEVSAICSRCSALSAVTDFDVDQSSREKILEEKLEAKAKSGSSARTFEIGVVVLALFIVPLQLLAVSRTAVPEPEVDRSDPYEVTEECILNLLIIADMLQEGLVPDENMVCPASNDLYIVSYVGDDIIVEDPHPELHGYSVMRVSKNNPFPEIVE